MGWHKPFACWLPRKIKEEYKWAVTGRFTKLVGQHQATAVVRHFTIQTIIMRVTNLFKVMMLAATCVSLISSKAQSIDEAFIRNLDNEERLAVLKGDSASLFTKYWSADMIVNTPANVAGTIEGTKKHVRDGKLDYATFDRNIERISILGNVSIVMGLETLKPQGKSDNVGKTVKRRFTNVWMKQKDGWRLVARQATIIEII